MRKILFSPSRAMLRTAVCVGFLAFGTAGNADPDIVDLPAVTVTATRSAGLVETAPFSTTLLSGERAREAPVATPDDFLRQIPNFSLFRRSSSLEANPSAQGASLRGIGPSGASRTLVLLDGVPFNDAFGGWVYWSQIDLNSIERIEVVRGGGSAAWGNTALGGVVQVIPRRPTRNTAEVEAIVGTLGTRQAGIYASDRSGSVGVSLQGRYFTTDGAIRVREDQRGAVDIPLYSRHRLVNGVLEYDISRISRLTLRGTFFSEDRGNGTPLTVNDTTARRLHAKLEWQGENGSEWRADAYIWPNAYRNTFTSVSPDRNQESLALDQYSVPSEALGGSLQRTGEFGMTTEFTVGADFRRVEGETNEFVVFQGADRVAGGKQLLLGTFLELDGVAQDGEWRWHLGLRGDYWSSTEGFVEQPNQDREFFADRSHWIFNARAGISRQLAEWAQTRAAVYQAFRVPTINELYRQFQVGADVTRANPDLDPERLLGVEAGVDLFPADGLTVRGTAFYNDVNDPILNVTVGTSPQGGQLRQRRNIEKAEVRGLELDVDYYFSAPWQVFASYALTDAQVRNSSDQPALEGNRLAQVARHVVTGGLRYRYGPRGAGVTVQSRWNGAQFENDLNTRRLGGYLVIDASVDYRFTLGNEVFLSLENILDRHYPVGITGANLVTEGLPRLIRGGVRWSF